MKSKKDVILLFTADWTDENSNVLEEIFCKKEFTKKYSKKYLFANVTLLQQDFITMELGENATQEQIDAAQKLQAEYEKKNEMVQNYSVKNFPDLFIVSGEGYVLSHVEFDQEKWTEELVDEKISQAVKESEELKNLLLDVRSTKGVEKAKRDREDAKAIAEAEARNKALAEASKNKSGDFDFHKQMQESLSRQYGKAPEGFEWSYTGELVSKGDDDSATAEDVVYMFLRSLSILDLSTATRYSDNSEIISSYKNFYADYGDITDPEVDISR